MKSNDAPALGGWLHAVSEPELESYMPIGRARHDSQTVLFVTTNRIAAYGCVFPNPIPGKAVVTNQLSLWWYEQIAKLDIPTHFLSGNQVPEHVAGRAALCSRLDMYPVDVKVYSHMTQDAWEQYRASGAIGKTKLTAGLSYGQKLPQIVCQPAVRTKFGRYDENLSETQLKTLIGGDRLHAMTDYATKMFTKAAEFCHERGIILAQARFMFGDGLTSGRPMVVAAGSILTSGSAIFWKTNPETREAIPSHYSMEREALYEWIHSSDCSWDPKRDAPDLVPMIPAHVVRRLSNDFEALYEIVTDRVINY